MLSSDFLPAVGGIASHVLGLSRALQRAGHEVDVVMPYIGRRPNGEAEWEAMGVRVEPVRIPRIPKLMRLVYGPRLAHRLRELHAQRRYDLVHWHTLPYDGWAAARSGIACRIFTNHTSDFLEMIESARGRRRAAWILAPAQRVIAPSQELADRSVEAGFPADRVLCIPNGVNADRFRPGIDGAPTRQRHAIPPGAFVFICARRLDEKNGVRYWAAALPLILAKASRPVHFLFVGDAPDDERSDRRAVLRHLWHLAKPSAFTFAGSIPTSDMPLYYAASSAAVLPSLREATSITGLESMASGLPLIGTRVGGIPEIVEDGVTGMLVTPASTEALATAALDLMGRPAEAIARMGRAARRAVEERFSWDAVAQRTVRVYEGMLAAEGGGA